MSSAELNFFPSRGLVIETLMEVCCFSLHENVMLMGYSKRELLFKVMIMRELREMSS